MIQIKKFFHLLLNVIFSFPFVLLMLFILGAGAGVATFIENDFGTQTAKTVVYNSRWYEVIMVILAISLIGILYRYKLWKRNIGSFIFHLGFIVILIGAGLTRYFGYEGVMHIREGASENVIISEEPYLQIFSEKERYQIPLRLGKIGDNYFKYTVKIDGKDFKIEYVGIKFGKRRNDKINKLIVDVTYDGKTRRVEINGGHGTVEYPAIVTFGENDIELGWGSKIIELDFNIKLVDFQLERYPGSMSPSSYDSEVVLIDKANGMKMPYRIYMNHPLEYKNFKFFQSSYDRDEKGTVLSANYDPGKWPTYLGYLMLTIGFIMNFFAKNSRFSRLRKFLRKEMSTIASMVLLLSMSIVPLKAESATTSIDLKTYKERTAKLASSSGELLVLDSGGRCKPIDSLAIDIVNKISGTTSLYGLSPNQVILGMLTIPRKWQTVKMIKVTDPNIKKFLGIKKSEKYISFNDLYNEKGIYKLYEKVEEATQKDPSMRGTFDRNIIKLDERVNVAYATYKGAFFKVIPHPKSPHNWMTLYDAVTNPWVDPEIVSQIDAFIQGYINCIDGGDCKLASNALSKLKEYQRNLSADIIPSETKIKIEIIYNHIAIFDKLILIYLGIGILIFIYTMSNILINRKVKWLEKLFFALIILAFISQTIGLGVRWYISGHAPWSDAYESLVYIAWSAVLAGLISFRRSLFTLSASTILAGIFLFVAHLNFVNPQIANLVPVLKSYWLTIHVSIITGSYGFLGLSALLGFITLLLMAIKNSSNKERIDRQIMQIAAVNEISMIIGLSMLTVGNFIGGVWANESWGRYWGWDSKETWTFVTIVVYTIVLHLRFIRKLDNIYVLSLASVVAFSSVLMTYFGVNFYLSGLHSYASGDSVPIPAFVYYIGLLIAIFALLAYRGRGNLRIKA